MPVPARVHPRILVTLIVVLVAACAAQPPVPSTPGKTAAPASTFPGPSATPPPTAPASMPGSRPVTGPGLLLEVTGEGGFINPVVALSAVPQVVVGDDGRIFTPGAMPDAGEQPLIPAIAVRDVGPAGAATIAEAIRAAGLDHEQPGTGVTADMGVTVFKVVLDGAETANHFAPAAGSGQPGLPGVRDSGAPDAAALAADALLARLTDPTEAWGSTAAVAPVAYRPTAYRVYAAPADTASEAGSATSAPAWPLATSLDAFGAPAVADVGLPGLRAGIVRGSEAAAFEAALGPLTAGTAIASAGRLWQLWVRPLLPGEMSS